MFIEGSCCCTKVTSELRSALIGIEDAVSAGGRDRDTAGAVLSLAAPIQTRISAVTCIYKRRYWSR